MPGLCLAVPSWLALTWDILRFSLATVLLWSLVFAGLGLVAAVAGFFALRAASGYRWGWRHARWFRLATLVLMVVVLPPLFGLAGALQGMYTAADRVLTESEAANGLYAAVGSVGADAIAAVYVIGPELSEAAGSLKLGAIALDELEGFRSGQWEIRVPELVARLAGTSDEVLESIAARAASEARGRFPALNRGFGSWFLTTSLDRIILPLLKETAHRKSGDIGIPAVSGPLLEGMAEAASRREPRDTIGRRELSSHLVRRWIVGPLLLQPLRASIRPRQVIVWGIIGLVVLLPVVFFQVAHLIWLAVSRRRESAS
jgi:hypothetical protein